jgi:hypothetical protein
VRPARDFRYFPTTAYTKPEAKSTDKITTRTTIPWKAASSLGPAGGPTAAAVGSGVEWPLLLLLLPAVGRVVVEALSTVVVGTSVDTVVGVLVVVVGN